MSFDFCNESENRRRREIEKKTCNGEKISANGLVGFGRRSCGKLHMPKRGSYEPTDTKKFTAESD